MKGPANGPSLQLLPGIFSIGPTQLSTMQASCYNDDSTIFI